MAPLRRKIPELRDLPGLDEAPLWRGPLDAEPMLAWTRAEPFSREGWLFEVKYDGFRMLAALENGKAALRYRRGAKVSQRFPEIVTALARLPASSALLDGELVVFDREGRSCFESLQARAFADGSDPRGCVATLCAFDLLVLDGRDLRKLPLVKRKALLEALLAGQQDIRCVEHVETRGEALFEGARDLGLEGIVAKRADSFYESGRSRSWVKVKADHTARFAVLGLAPPSRETFGMRGLHLGRREGNRIAYAGRVGLPHPEAQALLEVAPQIERDAPACTGLKGSQSTWLEPVLECEVRYMCLTSSGRLRQPHFIGFTRPGR